MDYLKSQIFEPFTQVTCGFCLKLFDRFTPPYYQNMSYSSGSGISKISSDSSDFFKELDIAPEQLAELEHIHSNKIVLVKKPGFNGQADAMITNLTGIALGIYSSECYPVFLYDPRNECIGGIRAGRRGITLEIVALTIETMQNKFGTDPAELLVWIGPGISAQKKQPVPAAANEPHPLLDLKLAILKQLFDSGVKSENVEILKESAFINNSSLYCYRPDGNLAGRYLGIIMLRDEDEYLCKSEADK